jgi:2-isopropylmalate synthase
LLETEYGIVMPRRMQVAFSAEVQRHTDRHGGEMSAADLWTLFSDTYLADEQNMRYIEHHLFEHGKAQGIRLSIEVDGITHLLTGEGNGPIDAAVHALHGAGIDVQVRSYEERSVHASEHAGDAQACAFIELAPAGGGADQYGVGIDGNIVTASVKALLSGVNRLGDACRSAISAKAA